MAYQAVFERYELKYMLTADMKPCIQECFFLMRGKLIMRWTEVNFV